MGRQDADHRAVVMAMSLVVAAICLGWAADRLGRNARSDAREVAAALCFLFAVVCLVAALFLK